MDTQLESSYFLFFLTGGVTNAGIVGHFWIFPLALECVHRGNYVLSAAVSYEHGGEGQRREKCGHKASGWCVQKSRGLCIYAQIQLKPLVSTREAGSGREASLEIAGLGCQAVVLNSTLKTMESLRDLQQGSSLPDNDLISLDLVIRDHELLSCPGYLYFFCFETPVVQCIRTQDISSLPSLTIIILGGS